MQQITIERGLPQMTINNKKQDEKAIIFINIACI